MAECLAGLPWVWVWGGYGDRNSVPTAALMSRPVGFASHSRRQPQHHGVVHAVSARRAGAIVHRCGGGGGGRHALLSVIKLGNTAAEERLSRAVESPTLTSPRLACRSNRRLPRAAAPGGRFVLTMCFVRVLFTARRPKL